MTCTVFVAFTDGTCIEEEIPNHELDDIQTVAEETSKELYVAIDIEDQTKTIVYKYRRKTTYAY